MRLASNLGAVMRNVPAGRRPRNLPRSVGNALAQAAITSSSRVQPAKSRPDASSRSRSHRQASWISPSGTRSWKKRWARPSLLTKVPSASVKAPAGSTISAFRAVSCSDDRSRRHGGADPGSDRRPTSLGASIEVVFEHDDGLRGALFDRLEGVLPCVPPIRLSPRLLHSGTRRHQRGATCRAHSARRCWRRPGSRPRSRASSAGDNERALRAAERFGDLSRKRARRRPGDLELRADAASISCATAKPSRARSAGAARKARVRDVVEPCRVRRRDKERAAHSCCAALRTAASCQRGIFTCRRSPRFRRRGPPGAARGRRAARYWARPRPAPAPHPRLLHLPQRAARAAPEPQNTGDEAQQLLLACADAEVEVLRADQSAQREIGFERGARRADADRPARRRAAARRSALSRPPTHGLLPAIRLRAPAACGSARAR